MRIAVCALSAVLLSGCSWLGFGGNKSNLVGHGVSACGGSSVYGQSAHGSSSYGPSSYGQGGSYGFSNTNTYGSNGYGSNAGFGQAGFGGASGGCSGAGGYGVAGYGTGQGLGQGFGQGGYGAGNAGAGYGSGYGANGALGGAANGLRGSYGGAGFAGTGLGGAASNGLGGANGAYGSYGNGTVLGGSAPYGSAVGANGSFGGALGPNGQSLGLGPNGAPIGGQYVNGQWVSSTSYAGGTYDPNAVVQTVQGSPLYVNQPYPQYYGVPQPVGYFGGLRGLSGGALPFGLEFGIGKSFDVKGDIASPKPAGPGAGGGATPLNVSATGAVSYADAYKDGVDYDMAATYDLDRSTTLLGRVGYSKAEGNRLQTGTLDDGVLSEDLYAQWGDLEQVTVEGGIRKYVGGFSNGLTGLRPYIGATAGMTHNNNVDLAQESATLMPTGANVQRYIEDGWQPTASGVIGAEMQIGARSALGFETGIRWSDNMKSIQPLDDRWSVPVRLRGRVSF